MSDQRFALRLAEQRRAFDEAFARPPSEVAEKRSGVLVVGVGRGRFALRLDELAGLHVERKIVRLPIADPALLGIAGIRGRVVPVFALDRLLGGAGAEGTRWMALAAAAPIAVAFGELVGHRALAAGDITDAGASHDVHVRQLARIDGAQVPIVSLESMVAAIRNRGAATGREEP